MRIFTIDDVTIFLLRKIFFYFKREDLRRSRSDHLGRWRQGDRPVLALYLQKSGRAASQRFLSLRDYLVQEGKLSHRPTRRQKVNRLRHLREPLTPKGANTDNFEVLLKRLLE